MSAKVRLFSYDGVATGFVADYAGQQSFTAVTLFKEPYRAKEMITISTGAAQSSNAALAPSGVKLLRVQVEPGKRVHYEVNQLGQDVRVATTESPIIEGNDQLWWTSSATISLREAS